MRPVLVLLTLLALVPALAGAQGPACGGERGADSADVLTGTEAADTIDGGGGADRISGLGGDDCLDGGDGGRATGDPDTIEAGPGNDTVEGGGGDDLIDGGPGNDVLNGGFGDDGIRGGDGDDELRGLAGTDRLDGGDGADRLSAEGGEILGGAGNDTVRGQDVSVDAGEGHDTVTLDLGASDVFLGGGDDRGRLVDGSATRVDCGPGRDTVTVDRRDRVTGCEDVTRRPMPDPRLTRRSGGARTTFTLTFASPLHYDRRYTENAEALTADVLSTARRCNRLEYEVRRARRGGARDRVRLAPPRRGWCRGRYLVQLWYRTYSTGSSCDSGDLTDEDCRGVQLRIGERLAFRVR